MADSKTMIDVIDTALKIGLGGVIGGITGVWISKTNNRHAIQSSNQERKKRIIEEILELVDTFNQTASLYWAKRANAASKIENNIVLSDEEKNDLLENDKKLFEDFNVINKCKAQLLLIGAEAAEKKLILYRDVVDEFFRIAEIENTDCTEVKLLDLRNEMSKTRKAFYKSLSHEFMDK